MKVVLLGTGTSHGIPVIACDCPVCHSSNPLDSRLRCSAYILQEEEGGQEGEEKKKVGILIDIGPEFRLQALKYGIKKVSALLLTHSHADHLHGLDDIRIFCHTKSSSYPANPKAAETPGEPLPIYSNKSTLNDVKLRFDYVFKKTQLGGGKPKLVLKDVSVLDSNPKEICGLDITYIPMLHGSIDCTGYMVSVKKEGVLHSFLYLTDCSAIPPESIEKIKKKKSVIDVLVIDGLRETPHSTHFSFMQALQVAALISPKNTYFTHICHNTFHDDINRYILRALKENKDGTLTPLIKAVEEGGEVKAAYDGMTFNIG